MKITGYRLLRTVHDWGRPVGDVNGVVGRGVTDVPVVLVETDAGITGIGLGSHALIDQVFPAILGEDPRAVSALYDRMLAQVFKAGHAGAVFATIGALDNALWDIKSKATGEPLWRFLGARDNRVPAYASGLDTGLSDEELVALYQRFAAVGFKAVKLKGGLSLSRDLQRLRLVQQTLAANASTSDEITLMLDVNESWHPKHGARYLAKLTAELDLAWIEEPVRRWDAAGHALIRNQVSCAVASGENLTGLEQFLPLITAGAVDILQTGSIWGTTHFLRVANLGLAHNLPISPVAYNTNPLAHAAAAIPNHLCLEVQDLGFPKGLTVDQKFVDGYLVLGETPGFGITVDEAVIAQINSDAAWQTRGGPHIRPADAGLRLQLNDTRGVHA